MSAYTFLIPDVPVAPSSTLKATKKRRGRSALSRQPTVKATLAAAAAAAAASASALPSSSSSSSSGTSTLLPTPKPASVEATQAVAAGAVDSAVASITLASSAPTSTVFESLTGPVLSLPEPAEEEAFTASQASFYGSIDVDPIFFDTLDLPTNINQRWTVDSTALSVFLSLEGCEPVISLLLNQARVFNFTAKEFSNLVIVSKLPLKAAEETYALDREAGTPELPNGEKFICVSDKLLWFGRFAAVADAFVVESLLIPKLFSVFPEIETHMNCVINARPLIEETRDKIVDFARRQLPVLLPGSKASASSFLRVLQLVQLYFDESTFVPLLAAVNFERSSLLVAILNQKLYLTRLCLQVPKPVNKV